jgi:hypothetical protein
MLSVVLAGCVTLEEVSDTEMAGGATSEAPSDSDDTPTPGVCPTLGWAVVRLGARDQATSWSSPMLVGSCGTGPYRLIGEAPRLGASLEVSLSSRTGRAVEASYATEELGADGESWGPYVAPMEVTSVRVGVADATGTQPFEFAGSILGPYGVVAITASGCASFRASPC